MTFFHARRFLTPAALAAAFLVTAPALADAPGGDNSVCVVEGLGCSSCEEYADPEPSNTAEYAQCKSGLESKGLVEACRESSGGGNEFVWFCPKGVTVERSGGGCAFRPTGAGVNVAFAAGLVALVALGWRRRRG